MSAIGEWSSRIKNIIENKDYTDKTSKVGIFEVKFWMYGKEMKIRVDDRLFTTSETNLMFAKRTPRGAWWAPILEKAGAKFYGTYENLHGGNEHEAIYTLTGMPSTKL